MAGKAILTCRPNSHPFQERTLSLEQPVKIGRSVARSRAAANNAIFDCKVLSRNHAVIWYANGKFFLQDTKSSNGTFVNNQRLSKSGEESLAREVSSGDIVQFGVDVLENSRKVTHGCIIANLRLYLPDGKEAKASESTAVVAFSKLIQVEDLYELHHYLQDAIQREHLLETKLLALQAILNNIRESADRGWNALIAEDSLLTRVEALENQLQLHSKNFGEDKLKDDLKKLQEDKTIYQTTAKAFLKKILEEKLDAEHKYDEARRSLVNLEAQCSDLTQELSKSHSHILELAQKLSEQMTKNDESDAKLQELEEQNIETLSKLENKNQELEELLARQENDCIDRKINVKSVFDHQPKSIGDIENDEDTNKENKISNITSEDFERLKHSLEKQRKCKEVLELIMAQRDLLQAEKHAFVEQLNSLQDDYDESCSKKDDVEDECKEVEANIKSLQAQVSSQFTESVSRENNISLEEKLSCKQINPDESIEARIEELKALHYEAKANKFSYENSISVLKEDINHTKESLNKTSGSCSYIQEKLEKAQKDYEDSYLTSKSLTDQVKLKNQDLIVKGYEIDSSESFVSKTVNELPEKENEQVKLNLSIDGTKTVPSEVDSINVCESNKILEELHLVQEQYLSSQKKVSCMESEIIGLKEECTRLLNEKETIETEFTQLRLVQNTGPNKDELFAKINTLEENMVTLASQYIKCHDERITLSQKLASASLDIGVSSQHPILNLLFALPCVVLILGIAVLYYPTLSYYMGTAE